MTDELPPIPLPGTPPAARIDGEKIRRLREEKGLTQLYVATVVGVTTDTISRWENRRSPSIKPENAKKLAEALDVPMAEILEQAPPPTAEPEETAETPEAPSALPPPPEPPRSRRLGIGLALFLTMTIAAIAISWWFSTRQAMPVTAVRALPPHAPIGLPFPVTITVTPSPGKSIPLIISETVIPGCSAMEAVPPFNAANTETRTVRWIAKAEGPTTFSYLAMFKPDTPLPPLVPFRGRITLPGAKGATTPIGGANGVGVAPYHWADRNRDFKIDDEEILTVYDTFGAATGLNLEASMIEDIWSGHGYRWDAARRQLVVIP